MRSSVSAYETQIGEVWGTLTASEQRERTDCKYGSPEPRCTDRSAPTPTADRCWVICRIHRANGTLRHTPFLSTSSRTVREHIPRGYPVFGGGPIVISLLREYAVQPGWVSSRDFLIGLAIIQAFLGPNFNFSVYPSALALRSTNVPTIVGALLGFLGIFFPALTLVICSIKFMTWLLRGINASAVGLVFTAAHPLW
ncbi:chromate ion transporter [Rhizoctonia solani AG-3 Rhs1AP]|uniref:Chromate ion transporter n=2 Tax=Rhizoctonia solani AG-3 TaxID=1086053 RepID=A0A074RQ76_9AGAM|nr:chromate ion transporter [Rhizoctonia solani AG-3 Rhs1AP]KEP46823.1 chromate ion transporter [Rhizoctonia solani 123E]